MKNKEEIKKNERNLIFLDVDESQRLIDRDLDYLIDEHWLPYQIYVQQYSRNIIDKTNLDENETMDLRHI
jgi:hypothetical protein